MAVPVVAMSMVAMPSAAVMAMLMMPMFAAVVMAVMFTVRVMITFRIGIADQRAGQQRLHRLIGISRYAVVQLDSGLLQRILGTAANAAADQPAHALLLEKRRQRTMPAAGGRHNLLGNHSAFLHVIQLKLLRVTKMLENLSVLVGDRNSHIKPPEI